jgi:hypothetical protein
MVELVRKCSVPIHGKKSSCCLSFCHFPFFSYSVVGSFLSPLDLCNALKIKSDKVWRKPHIASSDVLILDRSKGSSSHSQKACRGRNLRGHGAFPLPVLLVNWFKPSSPWVIYSGVQLIRLNCLLWLPIRFFYYLRFCLSSFIHHFLLITSLENIWHWLRPVLCFTTLRLLYAGWSSNAYQPSVCGCRLPP